MLGQLLLLAHIAVICDPADPLRRVAEEIAREEHVRVGDSWSEAHAEYGVWVIDPGHLSDRTMVDFARAWRDRFPETAVGLITGRTPEQALALWRRARDVRATPSSAFDTRRPFPKQRFVEALKSSGYVTFAGHGSQTYLQIGSEGVLEAKDLPYMANVVIGTESCNVFRPWVRDSIALAFVEKGAAAFAGFAFSPESGFLIGCYDGLPFRYTSPEFPIGRVVQLQNRGAMQAFAALPIYFLLGDPRIALSSQPPYRVVTDVSRDGSRLITLTGAPRGIVPIRIRGGVGYSLVETSGTATSPGHGFYNSRLQALDSGSDKFVLVDYAQGPLTLWLRRDTPWWWPAKTLLVEALDNALVFIGGSVAGSVLAFGVGFAVLVAVVCRGATKRAIAVGAIAGALLAALQLSWVLARLGHVTVTSKNTSFNVFAIIGTFVLTGSAGALYMLATGRRGRATALLLATLPVWLPAVMVFWFTLSTNAAVFQPLTGASIYNHQMALLAACSSAIVAGTVICVFSLLRRRLGRC
jgi:hypothetical protein